MRGETSPRTFLSKLLKLHSNNNSRNVGDIRHLSVSLLQKKKNRIEPKVLNCSWTVGEMWLCMFVFTVQAEENLGMVMIFTLVTAVQEKLNTIVDVMKNRQEEEKRRKEKEAQEAEKVESRRDL